MNKLIMSIIRWSVFGVLACLLTLPAAYGRPQAPLDITLPLYRTHHNGAKIYIEATLPDGSRGLFLVDTGADISILSPRVSERLGLGTGKTDAQITGLTTSTPVPLDTLDSLIVGGALIKNLTVASGVPGVGDQMGPLPIAGLLGNNVWRHFIMEIDYGQQTLRLTRKAGYRLQRGASPMIVDRGHIYTLAELTPENEPQTPHLMKLAIDTAARGIILRGQDSLSMRQDVTEGLEPVIGIGTRSPPRAAASLKRTRRLAVSSIRFGGRALPLDLDIRWLDFTHSLEHDALSVSGIVGHEIFEGNKLTLDYLSRRVLLQRSLSKSPFNDARLRALRILDEAPPEAQTQLVKAELLLSLGRTDEAAEILTPLARSLEGSPPSLQARLRLAEIERERGNNARARALIASLTIEQMIDAEVFVSMIGSLLLEEHTLRAYELCERARLELPRSPQTWIASSDLALAMGDTASAQLYLTHALELEGSPDTHLLRQALISFQMNDQDATLALLRRGLYLNPLDGRHLWFLAQLAAPEDHALVRSDLQRLKAMTHPTVRPFAYHAAAAHLLGDTAGAHLMKSEGIARDCGDRPSLAEENNCIAWHEGMAFGNLTRASKLIDTSLLAKGPTSAYLDTKSMVESMKGEAYQALELLRQAAFLNPSDPYLMWRISVMERSLQGEPSVLGE